MIRGIHGLVYTSDAQATREFIRDKLQLPHTDVGEGWLIFDLPEGDLGCHPIDDSGQPPAGRHEISFYCDDIRGTVEDLRSRGVSFRSDIADHGYGFVTYFSMPGGVEVQLYQPKYAKRTQGRASSRRASKRTKPARRATKRTKAARRGGAKKRRG
jgi:predicted enzyme related to lactoylglutathione lyase